MPDIIKNLFLKYFHKPIGFIAGFLLIILTIIISIDSFVSKYITESYVCLLIYAGILLIWTILWFGIVYTLPKNNTKKIGILIALTTENDKQKVRIKNDFVGKINELYRKTFGFSVFSLRGYALLASDCLNDLGKPISWEYNNLFFSRTIL